MPEKSAVRVRPRQEIEIGSFVPTLRRPEELGLPQGARCMTGLLVFLVDDECKVTSHGCGVVTEAEIAADKAKDRPRWKNEQAIIDELVDRTVKNALRVVSRRRSVPGPRDPDEKACKVVPLDQARRDIAEFEQKIDREVFPAQGKADSPQTGEAAPSSADTPKCDGGEQSPPSTPGDWAPARKALKAAQSSSMLKGDDVQKMLRDLEKRRLVKGDEHKIIGMAVEARKGRPQELQDLIADREYMPSA